MSGPQLRNRIAGVSPLARASARSKEEDVAKILKDADTNDDSLLSLQGAQNGAVVSWCSKPFRRNEYFKAVVLYHYCHDLRRSYRDRHHDRHRETRRRMTT
ncbi:hypothetical protein AK812_SmicGene20268 [Symbiodinium microadriaticum]|uniref:Uncharacterized protein n=1 Tax=Symbiodinium microadriaticum TaxID=2951 RepID=A0A1Q9DQF6_SYMMI|nr:hypothetical protein AK812_SmicGene20268 [Symbiodinium microadriaticum]